MALRLPPLSTLRLFEAAGRHESFKDAAEELHLTPSAVSHGIVTLERWLGVALFERRTNGVVLTKVGKDYFAFVSEALAMIAVGTRRLPSAQGGRRVSISVAPTFAVRWVLPRLADFKKNHPRIALNFDTSHRQVGFPVDNVDLAIRMARAPWPDLPSKNLFIERLVPLCSPGFFEQHAKQGKVDLNRVPLLHIASVTEDWAAWFDATGSEDSNSVPGLSFDTVQMTAAAAANGLGVALGRLPLMDEDIESGLLMEAGWPTVTATTGYWLVYGPSAEDRPEVKAFADWLLRCCGPGEGN